MRSRPKAPISWSFEALTILVMEFSGPGVSPRDSAEMTRALVYLRPAHWQYQSAIFGAHRGVLNRWFAVDVHLAR